MSQKRLLVVTLSALALLCFNLAQRAGAKVLIAALLSERRKSMEETASVIARTQAYSTTGLTLFL